VHEGGREVGSILTGYSLKEIEKLAAKDAAEKALTDGMFTVLFSTTPLSASRSYSVNIIPSVNAFGSG
jgi:hypothetical protein